MESSRGGSSSDERETSINTNNNTDKKIYHRHSSHQIQRLEAYFKECPHPDDSQRRKLGQELQLKPKQIKFWFQNKRTQAKTQSERADNTTLRRENMKIRCENEAIKEALKTVTCPPCGGPRFGIEERKLSLQQLRLNNAYLKEQMYEQLHILSPLVPPREFIILRCCEQVEEDLWVIADVSYHHLNVEFEFETPTCSKRPSGCLIQALPDGRSKVTWIEHVEVNDKVRTHRLYKDLLCGGSGYGARRWTVTLERMCERLSLSSISVFPTTDYAGVVKTIEGRNSVMNLGERMLKNFAWILKMSGKVDFSQLSKTNNSGVRVSVRTNIEAGQPTGLIVCAGSSLCLPLSPLQVYNFLNNVEIRHQWDVLCHGNPVAEVARFVTGTDHNNRVTILQPIGTEYNDMMIIQDGFVDSLGGMVVYAPVDLNTANAAISGQVDPSIITILPSGFIISRDGRPSAAELEGGLDNCTTLLTVAFQILVSGPPYSRDSNMEESTSTVNTLISSTVQRIKAMLNCDDGQ